jgi:thiamine kinase-like enzyme
MIDLRAIPTADYIGSIDRQSCTDGVFYAPKHSLGAIVTGPFDTQEDMNQGMLRKFESSEKRPYINFLRTLISATLHDHRTFFAHEDLQLKNIMVQRTSSASGDPAPLKIKIIDWEVSG